MKHILFLFLLLIASTMFGQFDYDNRKIIENKAPEDLIIYADLDQDGDMDYMKLPIFTILGCYDETFKLYWSMNDGTGKFGEDTFIEEFFLDSNDELIPLKISALDYDNDGDNDLLIFLLRIDDIPFNDDYTYEAVLIRNNGNNTFQPGEVVLSYLDQNENEAYDIETLDFENDGDFDLLFSIGRRFITATNLGNGNFSTPTVSTLIPFAHTNFELDDVDDDGFTDLLMEIVEENVDDAARVRIAKNNNGVFDFQNLATPVQLNPFEQFFSFKMVDLNNDGRKDILTAEESDFYVYLNNGSSNYQNQYDSSVPLSYTNSPPGAFPQNFFIIDFELDDDPDIVFSDNTENAYRLVNQGNLNFTTYFPEDSINSFYTEYPINGVSDIDNDGKDDLLSNLSLNVGFDHSNYWLSVDNNYNTHVENIISTEIFVLSNFINTTPLNQNIDFDDDGDIDVLTTLGLVNKLLYYENDGSGNFSNPRFASSELTNVGSFKAAHMNDDNILDLVTIDTSDNTNIIVSLRDGNGGENQVILPTTNNQRSFILLDYENDGDLDVLARNFTEIFINDGQANFTSVVGGGSLQPPRREFKDINNDDIIDYFAILDQGTGNLVQLRLIYSVAPYDYDFLILDESFNYSEYNTIINVDLDDDGDLDLLYSLSYPSSTDVYFSLQTGINQFESPQLLHSFSTISNNFSKEVQFFDLDYNGLLDIVFSSMEEVSYILQTSNGVFSEKTFIYETDVLCDQSSAHPSVTFDDVNGDQIKEMIIVGDSEIFWMGNLFDILGVSEYDSVLSSVKIFPNPSSEFINIAIPNQSSGMTLKMFNMRGQEQIIEKCILENGMIELDISHLVQGIYIIQLFNNGSSLSYKVVKE